MSHRRGSLLVDALLAITIFGLVVAAFSSGIGGGREGAVRGGNRARAIYLAEEGLQAVRTIRDKTNGWATIKGLTGNKGVQLSGTDWAIANAPTLVDGAFTRTITIGPATPPNLRARKVTATVSWTEGAQNRSVSLESQLTDWHTNPPPPAPNWAQACVEYSHVETTYSETFGKVAISGNYALVTGTTGWGGPGFYIYDLTNMAISLLGTVDLHNAGSANLPERDVMIKDDYAYVAHTRDDAELMIIDINPIGSAAHTLSSPQNLPGNNDLNGLAINANVLHGVRESLSTALGGDYEYAEFNIGSPNETNPQLIAGRTLEMDDRVSNAIAVQGNYAYIGTSKPDQELTVLRLNDLPNSPPSPCCADASGAGSIGIATATFSHPDLGDAVFLGANAIAPIDRAWQLSTYDINATTGNPVNLGVEDDRYDTTGGPTGNDGDVNEIVTVGYPDSTAIALLATSAQGPAAGNPPTNPLWYFQAINITNPLAIAGQRIDNLDLALPIPPMTSGANGIAYRASDNVVVLVGGSEIVIIRPNGACTP